MGTKRMTRAQREAKARQERLVKQRQKAAADQARKNRMAADKRAKTRTKKKVDLTPKKTRGKSVDELLGRQVGNTKKKKPTKKGRSLEDLLKRDKARRKK